MISIDRSRVVSRAGAARTAIVAALLVAGAAACSSGSDGDTDPATDATPSSTATAGSPDGTDLAAPSDDGTTADTADSSNPDGDAINVAEALQFSAPLVGGGEFTGADYADKPTVFWFWAPT